MSLLPAISVGEWDQVDRNFKKLSKFHIGPDAIPTYTGLILSGLTASRLVWTNASKALASKNLIDLVAGTANEVDVVTDGSGGITIGIVNPLIASKGGTGLATITNHGLMLGSGTDAVTVLAEATNGQLPIGSTGNDPVLAVLTGTAKRVTVTNTAGTITLSGPQDFDTVDSPVFAAATIGSVAIPGVFTATQEPNGFVDRVATLSWDDGTYTFTITGNHDIYINGVKTTKTTASKQITDATGLYWIYYNASGVLTASTAHPGFYLPLIATVYWNTTTNKGLLCDERHGIQMDGATHEMLHYTVGSRYESGLTGVFDNTTLAIALGKWHDEDIEFSQDAKTTCNVLYHNGDANFAWDAGTTIYYKMNGANLRYNNGNDLADVGANRHMAMWIFTTNDITTPVVALMGQREDVTLANARLNNKYESLTLGTLPYQEMKLLYRVILKNTGATPTWVETEDLRSISNIPAGTYVATAHGVLTGLTNDDHTQYPLLIGRSGGQTIVGSTVTAEDLTLKDNSVDNNTITVTQAKAAYTHSGLTSGNPHSVTPTELSLVIGTNVQAYDAGLTSLAGLTFASASFLKCTAENTYAVRTISETKQDLSLDAVENTALSTWVGANTIVTVGTIATGIWNGTDIAIAGGGTGQGTAQLAINALTAVAGGTNEHVLTKDTDTGNAIWKAAVGGAGADVKVAIDAGATAGYLGATSSDGVLRTAAGISYTDGGDFITLGLNVGALTEITTVDAAADFIPVLDATDSAHKKILPTNLGHRYVSRGDPAAHDWNETGSKAVLNTDGNWHDLDCSAIVPVGTVLIHFILYMQDDATVKQILIRKKGNANLYNLFGGITQVINVGQWFDGLVACDANRKCEYMATNTAFVSLGVTIRGWWV